MLNKTVSPFNDPGVDDKLAIAVQLDGNAAEAPYDVYLDQVNFVINGSCVGLTIPPPFPTTGIATPVPTETPDNPSNVPEPGTLFLFGTGLIGILAIGWKRFKKVA